MYIDKRRVNVRIAQTGQEPLDGDVCLTKSSASGGPEALLDLLNSGRHVIPFIAKGDGSIMLLTRLNVEWVMVGERVGAGSIYPSHHLRGREEPVEIEFMNGSAIDGLVQIGIREAKCCMSDYLNGPVEFFPLVTRLGTLLVNKTRVRQMRLVTVTPSWAAIPKRGTAA